MIYNRNMLKSTGTVTKRKKRNICNKLHKNDENYKQLKPAKHINIDHVKF